MIGHARLQAQLASMEELHPRRQVHLLRHVENCEECRDRLGIVRENRKLLQALRPGAALPAVRAAALEAADKSQAAAEYLPLLIPFLVMPALVAAGLFVAALGGPALAMVSVAFLGFLVASALYFEQRDRRRFPNFPREFGTFSWNDFSSSLLADLLGVVLGSLLLGGILLLLSAVHGS